MKTLQQRTSRKKPLLITLVIGIIVLAIAACTYVYAFNGNIFGWNNGKTQTPTKDEKYDPNKQDTGEKSTDAPTPATDPDPDPNSTSSTPNTQTISVTITSARQNSTDLQVRTLIASAQSDGQCILTLEHANRQPVTQTAGIQAQPTSSTCQGFDVPLYKLVPGNWNITVDFKNGSTVGQAKTTITIN